MRGFDHATILSSSFLGFRKERLAQWPAFCALNYDQKFRTGGEGVLPEKLGGGCAARFLKPLPYFTPKSVINFGPERVTSCYSTYTVVGVNIKREMVLSPNDKEVANSSKKHTQFKTGVHKTIPYFRPKWSKLIPYFRPKRLKKKHTVWRGKCLYSIYRGLTPLPSRAKNALQIMSLLAYANLVPRAFPLKNFLREKPWGRGCAYASETNKEQYT